MPDIVPLTGHFFQSLARLESHAPLCQSESSPQLFGSMPLLDPQKAALRSVLDRMIPRDEEPSACDAGVDAFVMDLLEGDARHLLPQVSQGLDNLDAVAKAAFQRPFSSLSAPDQDSLLDALEDDFVGRMADLAAQGYYARPAR